MFHFRARISCVRRERCSSSSSRLIIRIHVLFAILLLLRHGSWRRIGLATSRVCSGSAIRLLRSRPRRITRAREWLSFWTRRPSPALAPSSRGQRCERLRRTRSAWRILAIFAGVMLTYESADCASEDLCGRCLTQQRAIDRLAGGDYRGRGARGCP